MDTGASLLDRTGSVVLEGVACPMGCPRGDEAVLTGHDRLHGLPGRFTVVKCNTCKLMRTTPRPDAATMGYYYPDDYQPYSQTRIKDKAPRKSRAKRRRVLRDRVKPNALPPAAAPGRLLELGCASGNFLHRMARAGWEVEGIEPSAHAAHQAMEAGYKVRNVSLEAAGDPQLPFDLIVGWMVLEHLHQPLDVLRKLRSWVRPDGWLVLSVPDAGGLEFRLFGDRWYALQLPTHLHHFSPETLTRMLTAAGWAVDRTLWHGSATNTLMSLSYLASDRGFSRAADFFRDAAERRRLRAAGKALGILLGLLRQSGRITVWARPS